MKNLTTKQIQDMNDEQLERAVEETKTIAEKLHDEEMQRQLLNTIQLQELRKQIDKYLNNK